MAYYGALRLVLVLDEAAIGWDIKLAAVIFSGKNIGENKGRISIQSGSRVTKIYSKQRLIIMTSCDGCFTLLVGWHCSLPKYLSIQTATRTAEGTIAIVHSSTRSSSYIYCRYLSKYYRRVRPD